jgi:hypothetical protein
MDRFLRNVRPVSIPTFKPGLGTNIVSRTEALQALERANYDVPGDNERMNTSSGIAYFMASEISRNGHKGPRHGIDEDAIGGWALTVRLCEGQYD